VRALPEEEQDSVLAYLLDRALLTGSAHGTPAPIAGHPAVAPGLTGVRGLETWSSGPFPRWAALLILGRLAADVSLEQLASELQLDPAIVRGTLQDAARRQGVPERVARGLSLIAEGRSLSDAASELDVPVEQLAGELQPTRGLVDAVSGALMGRTALRGGPVEIGGSAPGPLRTMPVRFPDQQYQRLKQWSEEHNFPMAVVVRGLVERFLDDQERSSA
jgi:hypothetical protein